MGSRAHGENQNLPGLQEPPQSLRPRPAPAANCAAQSAHGHPGEGLAQAYEVVDCWHRSACSPRYTVVFAFPRLSVCVVRLTTLFVSYVLILCCKRAPGRQDTASQLTNQGGLHASPTCMHADVDWIGIWAQDHALSYHPWKGFRWNPYTSLSTSRQGPSPARAHEIP